MDSPRSISDTHEKLAVIVKSGDSHDLARAVIRDSNPNRPQQWEDEAPAEPRFRRVRQDVPVNGRVLPGMPLEMDDAEDDDPPARGGARFGGQRFPARRAPWWRPAGIFGRILLGTATVTVLAAAGAGSWFLLQFLHQNDRFRIAGVSNIEAVGLSQVSRGEMLPVFGEDIGKNIFFIPIQERRRELEKIPWVERATVMRLLPDRIRVEIVERKPVAFARQGDQFGLVDARGVLLTMPAAMMAQKHYSFPVVTGINAADPAPQREARMAVYARLLAELDANGQKLSEQVSEIDLSDPEDARVLMPEQGGDVLAHFGEDHFMERYQRYKERIGEWRQQYPKLAAVDLRYDQQVVLQMTPGEAVGGDATTDKTIAVGANEKDEPQPAERQNAQTAKLGSSKTAALIPAIEMANKPDGKSGSRPEMLATKADHSVAKPTIAAGKAVAPVKTSVKAGSKPPIKAKTTLKTAKQKAAERAREKKRAEAKRAALRMNRRSSAPTHPAAAAVEGQ